MGSDSPAGGAAHAAQDAGGRGATGGLSSARAQRECDVPPRLEVRRRARQMQNHAADRADDVDPQLQQPVGSCVSPKTTPSRIIRVSGPGVEVLGV